MSAGTCMRVYCHVMWSDLEIAACHKGGMDPCARSGMTEIQLLKVNLSPPSAALQINCLYHCTANREREWWASEWRLGRRFSERVIWFGLKWFRKAMIYQIGDRSAALLDECLLCTYMCICLRSLEHIQKNVKEKNTPNQHWPAHTAWVPLVNEHFKCDS